MDITKIIQYTIVGIISLGISALLTSYLHKSKAKEIDENKVLEMPNLYFLLSNVLFATFILIEYIIFTNKEVGFFLWQKVIYSSFGLLLCFGGVNTFLLFKKHKIIYSNESIEQTSWLGKKVEIKWVEIINISFSPFASSLKVQTRNEKILIHEHIKGYKMLLNLIEVKTGLTLKK